MHLIAKNYPPLIALVFVWCHPLALVWESPCMLRKKQLLWNRPCVATIIVLPSQSMGQWSQLTHSWITLKNTQGEIIALSITWTLPHRYSILEPTCCHNYNYYLMQVLAEVDCILFSLLILRGLSDSRGLVWRSHASHLYMVEVTLPEGTVSTVWLMFESLSAYLVYTLLRVLRVIRRAFKLSTCSIYYLPFAVPAPEMWL